jgi:hypothetical protein
MVDFTSRIFAGHVYPSQSVSSKALSIQSYVDIAFPAD